VEDQTRGPFAFPANGSLRGTRVPTVGFLEARLMARVEAEASNRERAQQQKGNQLLLSGELTLVQFRPKGQVGKHIVLKRTRNSK
jgi:hypothetical protein